MSNLQPPQQSPLGNIFAYFLLFVLVAFVGCILIYAALGNVRWY